MPTGTDASLSILNYSQGSNKCSPQVYPRDIRIPFRQSKMINNDFHLRTVSSSLLQAIREDIFSPKAAPVVAPVQTNRRLVPCQIVSDRVVLELVAPMYVRF